MTYCKAQSMKSKCLVLTSASSRATAPTVSISVIFKVARSRGMVRVYKHVKQQMQLFQVRPGENAVGHRWSHRDRVYASVGPDVDFVGDVEDGDVLAHVDVDARHLQIVLKKLRDSDGQHVDVLLTGNRRGIGQRGAAMVLLAGLSVHHTDVITQAKVLGEIIVPLLEKFGQFSGGHGGVGKAAQCGRSVALFSFGSLSV